MSGWFARLRDWLRHLRRSSAFERLTQTDDPLAGIALHEAGGPACVVDHGGAILRANAAFVALVGLSPTPGKTSLPSLLPPVARKTVEAALEAACAHGKAASFTASLLTASDGAVAVALLPVPGKDGAAEGALLRCVDLTPQLQLEARLAHSQKLQATGQLAGGIAHDFNNLLTAVIGAADGILAREPPGETQEDAAQIRDSAQRGAALVRQLLAFGRQQRLEPKVIAVNDAIEHVCGLLRRLLGGRVRLLLALEQPGRRVRADPTQLDQVLINLAVNARDAMPKGGELTLRSGHITLYRPMLHGAETIPPGRYVKIEVQDTGEGIPPEVLPRIFDPFFTTKRERGGSGLGLSTVHGIVRQSDGFLAVDSEPGRGTSVRIYLPRWDGEVEEEPPPAALATPPPTPSPSARAGPATVLLVDDEDTVRKLAVRAFTRAGWRVIEADSGDSAVDLLAESGANPDLVVTDLVMPGMGGEELAQAARERCRLPGLPVIFVSGYAETQSSQRINDADTLFLAKPYSLADLLAAAEAMVEREQKTAA